MRLIWVQLINIDDVKLSNKNSVEKVYNYPERGYIYDKNNKLIVRAQTTFCLVNAKTFKPTRITDQILMMLAPK